MLTNSKDLLKIKNKLKKLTNKKEVLDVVLFGSAIKGKLNPKDIDIAIITKKEIKPELSKEFHVSIISIEDFFKPIPLINTLLREGFSVKHNKPFSEVFNFSNKSLFTYELKKLPNAEKVKLVNILHGRSEKGLVEQNNGKWLSRQVFLVPVKNENIFEQLFSKFKVKYTKSYVLIH